MNTLTGSILLHCTIVHSATPLHSNENIGQTNLNENVTVIRWIGSMNKHRAAVVKWHSICLHIGLTPRSLESLVDFSILVGVTLNTTSLDHSSSYSINQEQGVAVTANLFVKLHEHF